MSAVDFPIALRLEGRAVLMVGAGRVAEGRVRQLLEAKATVTVVSPRATELVAAWARAGRIVWHQREFEPRDVQGTTVIFTATDVPAVNARVVELARARGTLVNAADVPELCDFHMPAIGRRGPVTVAVSTAGLAPALSGALRTRALETVRPADARLARVVGWLRRLWPASPGRAKALKRLVDGGAAELIAARDRVALRALLEVAREAALPSTPPGGSAQDDGYVVHARDLAMHGVSADGNVHVTLSGGRSPESKRDRTESARPSTLFVGSAQDDGLAIRGPQRSADVGTVYLVGAGPGAADMLTLRAASIIGRADAICHDRLVHPDVLKLARPGARLFYVGKEGGGDHTPQDEINALLIAQARLGRSVVRLKNGDPFVFGRGGEEAIALSDAGVPVELVPGVTSGTSVPALFGIPVTHRGVAGSVTFATARATGGDAELSTLAAADTLVLYMAGQRLTGVTSALIRAGRSSQTPAAVIEAGSWQHQRIIEGTLGSIAALANEVGSPAMLVVGEVVALRHRWVQGAREADAQRKAAP